MPQHFNKVKQKTGMRAGSQSIVDYGRYKTQSEHSVSLNLKTKFLNFIAFPQLVIIERFSNRT
jgi:hypothetical protein